MGYTVIKASGNAYALNRSMQNLTPVDSAYRHVIPSNATFTYKHVTQDGICTLESVDLKGGTQPYVYRLCDSTGTVGPRAGVTINEINGVITLDDNYDRQDVYVKLLPLQIQDHPDFYPTVVTTIFKKVIAAEDWTPVTPTHTATLDSITYVIGNGTGWPQGIPASGATLILKSATITYDGTTTTFGDATAINTMAADVSNVNITAKIDNTNVLGSNPTLKQFIINSTNATVSRDINIGIKFDYKGITVTYPVTIPQQANTLISVTNPTGQQQVEVGTTLNASNYSATGTYSNGSTATVNATSIDPGTVTESGAHTYTLTFAPEVTTTIQITGQTSTLTKAHIDYISGTPYSVKSNNSYTYPLQVHVVHSSDSNLSDEFMGFDEYLSMNETKEEYGAPVVTMSSSPMITQNGIPSINEINGSMEYNFDSLTNYIYDHTIVQGITIPHSSQSLVSASEYNVRRSDSNKDYCEISYFENNFTEIPLTNTSHEVVPLPNSSSNPYVSAVSASKSLHLSNDSNPVGGTYRLSSSGETFLLNTAKILEDYPQGYVLKATNGYRCLLITTSSTINGSSSTGDLKTGIQTAFNGIDKKFIDMGDGKATVYVKHTPTITNGNTYIIDFPYETTYPAYRTAWTLLVKNQNPYGDIVVTQEVSVSPSSVSASAEQVTITPPQYSQSYNGSTVTNEGTITYSISIDGGEASQVSPVNDVITLPANTTSSTRVITLTAEIESHNKHTTSTVDINQAANSSVQAPKITSIVANTVSDNNYPYKQDDAAGTLVNTDNKLQIEYPLEVNVSGVGKMTYDAYKNAYPNSTYGNVIAKYKGPNGSGALYANTSYVDPTTGKYIIDLKADKCIVDRTGISKLTISNSNGSAVTLSSSIPTIHKLASQTVTNYFGQFTWNDLSFASTDNTSQYRLTSAHKQQLTGDYYYAVDQFKLASVSTTDANNKGRLRLLDTSDCYYIRIKYDSGSLKYFDFAIVEVPNGGTLSPSTETVYTGDTYGTLLGGYYTTGSASANEGTTGFMYIKYTPTNPNNKVYYVDAIYSDELAYMTVQIGQINQ